MKGDVFTLEIFENLISSVAQEMGTALHRTAFSPNIKERRDHSCAVFDPSGFLVAQAEHIPVHLGSMPEAVSVVKRSFDLAHGDLVILNDPFLGGTHLPDISTISPVFYRGSLIAILASRAHHSDVGGLAPGSLGLASDIYQEGIVIPPVLLKSRGEYQSQVEEFICANVRNPDERRGDLAAQITAHSLGERRIIDLASRYGAGELISRFRDLQNYSERLTRSALSRIPDGSYEFIDYLDDDGFSTTGIPVSVTVTIEGEEAMIDFAGSSPPVKGPLNCPLAVTLSATYYVFRCITGEHIPANDGSFRPLVITVPDESILNARPPSAVGGGNVETSQRIVDTLLGALSQALPESIPASSYGTMSNLAIGSGRKTDSPPFSYYETIAGGTGAGPWGDGCSGTHAHMTNTLNTPVEALEYAYPLRIRSYRIRNRSGGKGRFRGGDGIEREIELLRGSRATILSERRKTAPWGLAGGKDGARGINLLVRHGRKKELPSKCNLSLDPGDRIIIKTPGGGGWGRA